MAEDEYIDLTGTTPDIASRLSVPAGKEAAELPGALPTSHRRRPSISPGPLGGKAGKGRIRCTVNGLQSKALTSLMPFGHLLPPLDQMDSRFQEKLAAILHSTGALAYLHLQRYYEALKATRTGSGSSNPQQSPSNSTFDDYGAHHMVDVAEAIRGMPGPASPDEYVGEVSAEMAAKALSMFADTCVRRPPTRSVEGMMAAAQDSQGAQPSEVDLRDAPDLCDEDNRQLSVPDHDALFGLACAAGYTDLTEQLIRARGTTDFEGEFDCTPLMEACSAGHVDIVRILLAHGARVDVTSATNNTALIYAAAAGHLDCVRELLKTKKCNLELRNENGHCALMEAASAGHLKVVEELVAAGAQSVYMNANSEFKVGLESPLTLAAYKGHVQLVEYLLGLGGGSNRDEELHTALMEASMDGHVDVARKLLAHNAPVNLTSDSFESPLTLASCGGHAELVKVLLNAGANIEEPNDESYTPLMEASREGHTDVVRILLDRGAQVNSQTEETGETALTLAACGGFTDVVELLITHGGELELGANTPLMEASQEGHLETVTMILEHAKKTQKIYSISFRTNINSAFSLACENGHSNVAQTLVSYGADLNYETDHRTPLMKACKQGYVEIVRFLLKRKADVNKRASNNEATALSLACNSGHKEIVQLLLDMGSDPNVVLKDNVTCILEAAKNGHVSIVEMLLDCSGLPTIPTRKPLLPPNPAQHTRVRRARKPGQSNPQAFPCPTVPSASASAVLHAGKISKDKTLSMLSSSAQRTPSTLASTCLVGERNFQHHPSILNAFNLQGLSTLDKMDGMAACNEMYNEISELMSEPTHADLSEHYADIMIRNDVEIPDKKSSKYPCTIYESLKKDFAGLPFPRITRESMEAKAAERKDSTSTSKAALATSQNAPSSIQNQTIMATALAEKLLRNPIYEEELRHLNVADHKNRESVRKMCELALGGTIDDQHLEFFMQNSAVLENIKRHVLTAMCAMNGKHTDVPPAPFAYPSNYMRKSLANSRRTKSESAACADPPTCMREIDIIPPTFSTADPLDDRDITQKLESVMGESSKRMSSVVSKKEDIVDRLGGELSVDTQTESNHDTPLTLACSNGHTKMVQLLMSRGANMEHRDKKGFTPLILAATGGHVQVVELLLGNKADLEAQSERTKDTALSLACSGGRKEVVELLLKKGANKEHRNVSDYTPLSLAASGGYVDIVVMLLDSGAEINSRTGSKLGISPLMLAAMNGHKEATRILLERGSDINAQIETNRNTALTLACFQGRTEVVRLLLQYHANVEHRAKTGLTPLMEAANGGYSEVGELLLDAGADPNTTPVPSSRDTALTIAADKGHDKFVEMLVHRQASIDAKNKKGCTALWLACNGGHYETVRILVEHAADVDAQDNRRVSPLMVAFRKGHTKVIKFMVNHVTQFPSDQELDRFITTIVTTDADLASKCQECKIEVATAKEKQAKEAQKAAEALLQLLEEEEEQARSKKLTKLRQKEKKKAKKQAKKVEDPKEDESDEVSKSSTRPPVLAPPSKEPTEKATSSPVMSDRVPLMAIQQENTPVTVPVMCGISNAERQKLRRQEKKDTQRKRNESGRGLISTSKLTATQASPVSAPGAEAPKCPALQTIAQSQEEWVKANSKKNKAKSATTRASSQSSATQFDKMKEYFADVNGAYAGWKDVELSRRRAQVLTVLSPAIARVIGRGGANINAIREATGASIEVEKQAARRDQLERQITIRGTTETVRYAVQMINGLIGDSEVTVNDIVRQVLRGGNNSTASANSSDGGRPSGDNKSSSKMAAGATVAASSAPSPPTNVWQQRIAARQQMQQQQKADGHQYSSPTVDPTPAEAHPAVDSTSESGTAVSSIPPSISPAALSPQVQSPESAARSSSRTTTPPIEIQEEPTILNSDDIDHRSPRIPSPVDPALSASLISAESRVLDNGRNELAIRTSDAALSLSNVSTAPLDIISSSSLSSMSTLSSALPNTQLAGYAIPEQTSSTPPVQDLGISNIFVNDMNDPSHSKLSDIWGGPSGATSSEPWAAQLMLNGFGPMSMGTQNTQPPVSAHSDWGAAAAADPMLSFNQMRQSPMPQAPSNPYAGMEWNGKQAVPPPQPPIQPGMYAVQSPAQRPTAPHVPSQSQRVPVRSHGLTDNCLFNLAAQLAASQSTPSTPPLSSAAAQYYPSPSYTDPNALGMGTSPNLPQHKYPSSFQGAANEFESLTNVISSYNPPPQVTPLGNGMGNHEYSFTRVPTSSQPTRMPSSAFQFPITAPPPGFGGQPRNEMASSGLNTTIPPPAVPQMRSSQYFNAQMPPPLGATNGQHSFNAYNNAPPTSAATWMSPGKPAATSNHLNGIPPPQSMQWGGGWN